MHAVFFKCLLVRALVTVQVACQQAVHHHVRIPPDRRCEVGVVAESQAIVADIVR